MTRATKPAKAAPDVQFLTDPEAAYELNLGLTKFHELQQTDPDFPSPVWLGPRSKRHVRSELLAYAMSRRKRPTL